MVKSEKTSKRILKKAIEQLCEKGTDGLRMQELADACGVNKALVHYYFYNKEKLAGQVETALIEKLKVNLSILHNDLPYPEKIRFFFETFIKAWDGKAEQLNYLLKLIRNEPGMLKNSIPESFIMQIRKGMEFGFIRKQDAHNLVRELLDIAFASVLIRPVLQEAFITEEKALTKDEKIKWMEDEMMRRTN